MHACMHVCMYVCTCVDVCDTVASFQVLSFCAPSIVPSLLAVGGLHEVLVWEREGDLRLGRSQEEARKEQGSRKGEGSSRAAG